MSFKYGLVLLRLLIIKITNIINNVLFLSLLLSHSVQLLLKNYLLLLVYNSFLLHAQKDF